MDLSFYKLIASAIPLILFIIIKIILIRRIIGIIAKLIAIAARRGSLRFSAS
jgi:hypothetical protein